MQRARGIILWAAAAAQAGAGAPPAAEYPPAAPSPRPAPLANDVQDKVRSKVLPSDFHQALGANEPEAGKPIAPSSKRKPGRMACRQTSPPDALAGSGWRTTQNMLRTIVA